MAVQSKAEATPVTEATRDAAVKQHLVKRWGRSSLRITPGHRKAIAVQRSAAHRQRSQR